MRPDVLNELLLICEFKVVTEAADVVVAALIASEEEWHVEEVAFLANVAFDISAERMLALLLKDMLLTASSCINLSGYSFSSC
jgi:hypothetical protein